MATVGNVTIQGNVAGAPSGTRTFGPFTIMLPAAVNETLTVALTVGTVTVNVPTGASLVIITTPNMVSPSPNPSYGGTITINSALTIATDGPFHWKFPSTVTSFTITATAVGSVDCVFM